MKITQAEEVARQTVLEIELDDQDLEPYLDRAYRRVVRKINVPGFRKGKAPRGVIEGRFGRGVLIEDIMDEMVAEVTEGAISSSELDPVASPRLAILETDPFRFTATVPLEPTVELGDYASLRVERQSTEVTDELVERWIDRLRQGMATWEPVDRTVTEEGDFVVADATISVEGAAPDSRKNLTFELRPGSDYPYPGMAERMIGASVGEPTGFSLTVIADESEAPGGGQAVRDAQVTATVREIKVRRLMELDDEFARTANPDCSDLEDLRGQARETLIEQARQADDETLRGAALGALLEAAEVTVPDVLVDRRSRAIMEDRLQNLKRMGLSLDAYLRAAGETQQAFVGEALSGARRRLEAEYALRALAEAEGLEVGDEEMAKEIEDLRQVVRAGGGDGGDGIDPDSEETAEFLRDRIRQGKALDRLVEIVGGEPTEETRGEDDAA